MDARQTALWARIEAFAFDRPGTVLTMASASSPWRQGTR
jgi:hypothetical protein